MATAKVIATDETTGVKLDVIAGADEEVLGSLRQKLGTEEDPVDGRVRVDGGGKEWYRLGICNGPRVVLVDSGDIRWVARPGPEADKTQYLTDDEVADLKEDPSGARRLHGDGDLNAFFFDQFRRVCNSAIVTPVAAHDGVKRMVECPSCGSRARFRGPKPVGAA